MRTIAIGIFSALSLALAASAQAHTAGAGPGMMGPMMQAQGTGPGQHGGMAGHHRHMGAQQGGETPQQPGAAGARPMSGGCPMMSAMPQHGAPATTQK